MKPEVNMSKEDAHIRILHLEDNPRDAQLMQDILETAGLSCDIVLVSSREEYDAALAGRQFDLVLCDYNLPDYDGLSALKLARQMQPDTPIIIISGTVEEEQAVKCLHLGATDYLLKQRLERFVPAVQRALQEAKELQRRRAADARIHTNRHHCLTRRRTRSSCVESTIACVIGTRALNGFMAGQPRKSLAVR
ncbi:MAG TPA: response regulator [Nitrosospira sp.]|nr:response regulator [Nitrosospira sp.]